MIISLAIQSVKALNDLETEANAVIADPSTNGMTLVSSKVASNVQPIVANAKKSDVQPIVANANTSIQRCAAHTTGVPFLSAVCRSH